ncbi:hypothetical protein CEE37_15105 [candidate division LCP-89 bacterium B3_LCP]|uniref:Uncharacterized protein n=1 Tax=candidate division LCP-89 bacterium B3_LCP TaxID=2012998 RepID=A0A532UN24_UNCL8|nr:MAG: hypothetical protein CEE37_15105 [candidate division LCP-89 bacterium B3_LCP]
MKKIKRKKCCHCRCLFVPDPRNPARQNYCKKEPCRKTSKAASQRKWLSKPENRDYFKGPEHVKRVQEWRRENPGYWKRSKRLIALQDPLIVQGVENTTHNDQVAACALQDLLIAQPPVIIGLISNFIGSALQDDIANTLLLMQQSGQDILCLKPQKEGGKHDCQIPDFTQTGSQGAQKLQLD